MATYHHHHSHHRRPVLVGRRSAGSAVLKASKLKKKEEDDEVMAASFLQYCATCEKQIIVPSSSVLYCSESCRKKDSNKVLGSPPQTPFSSTFPADNDELSSRDIVPQRSPRTAQSKRFSYGYSEASDEESDHRSGQESEAARYLRQFQSSSSQHDLSSRTSRPHVSRSSASIVTMSNAPSLSHTPASTASFSLPYTPLNRPLPPRGYHSRGASSFSAKSVDLVLPYAPHTSPTATASLSHSFKTPAGARMFTENAEGEMLYEKRRTIPSASSITTGSLKKLFDYGDPLATPQAKTHPIGESSITPQ